MMNTSSVSLMQLCCHHLFNQDFLQDLGEIILQLHLTKPHVFQKSFSKMLLALDFDKRASWFLPYSAVGRLRWSEGRKVSTWHHLSKQTADHCTPDHAREGFPSAFLTPATLLFSSRPQPPKPPFHTAISSPAFPLFIISFQNTHFKQIQDVPQV